MLGPGLWFFMRWGPVKSWGWSFRVSGFGVRGFLSWDHGGTWVLGFEVSGPGTLEEAEFGGFGFQLLKSCQKLHVFI